MNSSTPPQPQQPLIVWWILWAAFQVGVVFIYLKLGGSSHPPKNEPALWALGFVPVLISGAIRWTLFPKFRNAVQALPVFVLGIALAEASCFLGLFIFPSHKLPLFIGSSLGILQFIPVYAARLYGPAE